MQIDRRMLVVERSRCIRAERYEAGHDARVTPSHPTGKRYVLGDRANAA